MQYAQEKVCIASTDELYPVQSKCNDVGYGDGESNELESLCCAPETLEVAQRGRDEQQRHRQLLNFSIDLYTY